MSWQDIVIAAGQLIFVVALVPAILDRSGKPPLRTSVTTAIVLFVFAVTFITVPLLLAAITSMLSGLAWAILAVQRAARL